MDLLSVYELHVFILTGRNVYTQAWDEHNAPKRQIVGD